MLRCAPEPRQALIPLRSSTACAVDVPWARTPLSQRESLHTHTISMTSLFVIVATLDSRINDLTGNYAENDIYYLEICVLSTICRNRDELFRANRGSMFRCHFDVGGFEKLQRDLMRWG